MVKEPLLQSPRGKPRGAKSASYHLDQLIDSSPSKSNAEVDSAVAALVRKQADEEAQVEASTTSKQLTVEVVSPLSRPLPPSPNSPIRPPKNRQRKRRPSVPDMENRPVALEAVKAQALAEQETMINEQRVEPRKPGIVVKPLPADLVNPPGNQGDMADKTFSRYASVRSVALIEPLPLTPYQNAVTQGRLNAQKAESNFLDAKVHQLTYEAGVACTASFMGIVQKRCVTYPYAWEECTFQVEQGNLQWYPLPKVNGPEYKRTQARREAERAALLEEKVPTLSASGSLPVNQVSLQLPSFTRVPVQAYCYDGEVATLSVAGGDSVQLRGLPYQLNQLSSALKKAQGEAEAMRGLKAAEVARLEFGNMSVKSVETQGGHMGGGATAAEMFLQFVRDNQYFEVRDRLDHGADVQMSDSTGATALLTSVKYGDSHKSITSLLLQRGALTDTTPAYLVELVKMADRNQNMDTITLLEQCAHRHC